MAEAKLKESNKRSISEASASAITTTIDNSTKSMMTDDDNEIIIRPDPVNVQIPQPSSSSMPGLPSSGTVTPVGNGRRQLKAPPVCRIPSLRKEHMTSEQMSKWCFSEDDLLEVQDTNNEHSNISDGATSSEASASSISEQPTITNGPISPKEWYMYKKYILNRNESRNGRESQRYTIDEQTGQKLRLTTGCVPIMNDGKILLVSSNKKEEWILPKGGWESDEKMEESALRETYEEGGILGVIGPKLSGIDFETRKAKKRRLELESLKKKCEIANSIAVQRQQQQEGNTTSSNVSVQSNVSSLYQSEDDQMQISGSSNSRDALPESRSSHITTDGKMPSPTGKDCLATKIRNELNSKNHNQNERYDDSASIASSDVSSNITHCRLSMFPLYVLEVRENWPESGRARKVVDIDTAIDTMSSRPEFHQVLLEVKRKGYHLRPCQQQQNSDIRDNKSAKILPGADEVETVLSNELII